MSGLRTLLRFEALGDLRVNIIKCSDWHQVGGAFPLENGQKLVDSQLKHNMGDHQDFLKCMVVFKPFSYDN